MLMTTARDIMTSHAQYVRASDSVHDAAVRMAELGVGALPVCGEDNRLKGMLTDRDVVVKVLAAGKDPRAVQAGEVVDGATITIGADEHVAYLLRTMAQHKVRRLPVIENHQLVGIVALADVARALDDPEIGLVVAAISE
jgi:CBS domain-containing protein